jgi:hypothetical protein
MQFPETRRSAELIFLCLGLVLAQTPAFAAGEPPCLSLDEVHGGYPRYHLVDGRRCWYASPRGPEAKASEPRVKPVEIDVNPYDDPIWSEPDASTTQAVALRAKGCEEQALKLDVREKRAFMKQCMASR